MITFYSRLSLSYIIYSVYVTYSSLVAKRYRFFVHLYNIDRAINWAMFNTQGKVQLRVSTSLTEISITVTPFEVKYLETMVR